MIFYYSKFYLISVQHAIHAFMVFLKIIHMSVLICDVAYHYTIHIRLCDGKYRYRYFQIYNTRDLHN